MMDTPSTSTEASKVGPGPVNLRQVEEYAQILNGIFDRFMELTKEDKRDILEMMVRAVKDHMSKSWPNMTMADVSIMMLTIMDPLCAALQESIDPQPVTTSDPEEDLPTGDEVIKMLLQGQSRAVSEHCITLFDSLSVATHHISVAMANLSALAKLVDVETFKMILKASACTLVQLNIDGGMLDPTKEKPTPSIEKPTKKK